MSDVRDIYFHQFSNEFKSSNNENFKHRELYRQNLLKNKVKFTQIVLKYRGSGNVPQLIL